MCLCGAFYPTDNQKNERCNNVTFSITVNWPILPRNFNALEKGDLGNRVKPFYNDID